MKKKIRVGDFYLDTEERKAIMEVLDSGRISEGAKVREFEEKWAQFIGTKYCVATSSGFGALMCILSALKYYKNLRNGTKVITTPLTYIADSSAISSLGFEPIYVDIDPETFCITPDTIEAHLKQCSGLDEYGLILPVDLMGYSVRIDEINQIAQKYNLCVIEDAAQAHDTVYIGKKAGSAALAGIFSFYIAHNIQAGEMGAVVTNDPEINRLVKKIKAQGRMCDCSICIRSTGNCVKIKSYKGEEDFDPRFIHDLIGYNFKTMEFQAALGIVQLEKAHSIKKQRYENVICLNKGLEEFSDILQLPKYSRDISYLAYPLVIKNPEAISRKILCYELEAKGIETRPIFGCIPTQQPAYAHLKNYYQNKLPNAEHVGKHGFYIGCHQYLKNEDLDYIIDTFREIIRKSRAGGRF